MVDDELANAEVLAFILEEEGYRVFVASNGKHGLERVAELKPEADKRAEEMAKLTAEAFARKMSEADLKGVADFFKSPLGQTYSKMRVEAMNDIVPVLQPWSVQTSNYLFDRLAQEMRKRGHTL